MSDHIMKIIPTEPGYQITESAKNEIMGFLKAKIHADQITVDIHETPAFIDCGSNLESIACPLCGAAIDFGWWGDAMDAASESGFMNLSIKLPCCECESSLNDLQYDFPCGFSCVEFSVLNPQNDLDPECLTHIQQLMGTPVRLIHAHL